MFVRHRRIKISFFYPVKWLKWLLLPNIIQDGELYLYISDINCSFIVFARIITIRQLFSFKNIYFECFQRCYYYSTHVSAIFAKLSSLWCLLELSIAIKFLVNQTDFCRVQGRGAAKFKKWGVVVLLSIMCTQSETFHVFIAPKATMVVYVNLFGGVHPIYTYYRVIHICSFVW